MTAGTLQPEPGDGRAEAPLPSPEVIEPIAARVRGIVDALDRALLGQHEVHELVVVGVLSQGHVLLEGMPGLGKTQMIHSLAQLLGLDFGRVQFTPDLMPSDIVGSSILQTSSDGRREMEFRPGPVFTNLLLADEINRASPKTQSALLEAMQEHRVTVLGQTRPLPEPFFVLASQNPVETEGTYPLPEAQLDRFLFKLEIRMPDAAVLEEIVQTRRRGQPPVLDALVDASSLADTFAVLEQVVLPPAVARYIAALVRGTHPDAESAPDLVQRMVRYGASPRAAIAFGEAARARALLAGRPSVGFEDVRTVAHPILAHRVILTHEARFERVTPASVVDAVLERIPTAPGALPRSAKLVEGAVT
ncbi:MAG: AAA family ATPase [Planctomycetota bacterium]